jgi:uncharacterized protein YecT (DUF1311 family)
MLARRMAMAGFACVLAATAAMAERSKLDARDSAVIQSCIRSAKGNPRTAERCIEIVAGPCLKRPAAQSTAGMVECAAREAAVWDDILNETFRRLRDKLDEEQRGKLRDMQRAWIESRDRTCGFYDVYHEGGSIARPMTALCNNRETARRALFLLIFLDDAEGR